MGTHIVPGPIKYDNLVYDSLKFTWELGLPLRFFLFSKVVCELFLIENERKIYRRVRLLHALKFKLLIPCLFHTKAMLQHSLFMHDRRRCIG